MATMKEARTGRHNPETRNSDMPWWGILLIALGSAAVGGAIVYVVVMLQFAKSFNW
jgi:hypothetical protein